jgi:ComF family protein
VLFACVASVAYEGAAEDWIHRFKYPPGGLAGLRPGPEAVVNALVQDAATRTSGSTPDLVIPIPLHPARLRERGFNPAAGLARQPCRRSSPLSFLERPPRRAPQLLIRIRETPTQTHLSREERQKNVQNAFHCPAPDALAPHVWLVDDVVTTGSTLSEAARTLARCGVEKIEAVCAARALRRA